MTADRAALLEKVTELIANGCGCHRACGGSILDCGCKCDATAAIDLIRAETLEEAAKKCESELVGSFDQYSQGYNDGCEESAAAIRALKEKT